MFVAPSGTVTFLFTDIEASTRLLHFLGRDRYGEVLREHQRLLREVWATQDGYEVDTEGDAFFVAFARPSAALAAAAEAQRVLASARWPQGQELRVRCGVHSGEASLENDRYVGIAVHRAARICSAAHGGQVLVSQTTADLSADDEVATFSLRDLGPHRLKDLTEPQQLYQLVAEGLASEFPPPKTLENRPTNLPVQATALIGREKELDGVSALIGRGNVRLLTLTGTGGTGKTRLALQVAAELVEEFPNGVFFVSLAPVSDAELVVPTIAQTLGLREQIGETVLETVSAYLRDKQLLLLLDNFEQVVAAAPAIASLRAGSPKLTVLVTSRTPLHLSGEHVYEVPPLTLPDPLRLPALASLSQYEAVALFVERAQAAKSGFTVTNENAPAIAQVCVAVDGLPLAVELAAARIRVLSPQALLGRLDQRLKLLTGGAQDLDERQQTVRATIEWSCDLLSEEEKRLFARVALFVDGCRLDAAETVCSQGARLELEIFDGLASLTEKSLLRQKEDPDGEPRFWMLETIREYALEQLTNQPDAYDLQQAYARYYLQFALEAETGMLGECVSEWLDRLDDESSNLTAALTWSKENDPLLELQLVNALARFWSLRGRLQTGDAWLGEALNRGDREASEERNVTLRWAAYLRSMLGDPAGTETLCREWLESARELGDRASEGEALYRLGELHLETGDLQRGREMIEEGLQISRDLGAADLTAKLLGGLGSAALEDGDVASALALFEEAVSLHRSAGSPHNVAVSLGRLAATRLGTARPDMAEAPLREALEIFCEFKNDWEISFILEGFADLVATEDGEAAVKLLGKADALRQPQENAAILQSDQDRINKVTARTRTKLEQAQWQRLWSEGQQLSMDDAVALAVGTPASAEESHRGK